MRRSAWILVALVSTGCVSAVAEPEGDGSSTGSSTGRPVGSTATTTTAPDVTTDALPTSTSTTGGIDPDSGSTSSGVGGSEGSNSDCNFLCEPDGGTRWLECSLWDQNCPPGEKCVPWANDGGASWNALRCVPIDPNPAGPGEPCTAEGISTSGIDNCTLGSICWRPDPKTGEGACVPHCVGTEKAPYCVDPQRSCTISGEGILTLCRDLCDPVDLDACPPSEGCYPIDGRFECQTDSSEDGGGMFENCEVLNGCNPGLLCVNPLVGGTLCDSDAGGCCLPACDLSKPICPPMTACTPWYQSGDAPPSVEHVGLCVAEAE